MYPLFNFGVVTVLNTDSSTSDGDGDGMGSSLAPNMLLAIRALRRNGENDNNNNNNDISSIMVSPDCLIRIVGSLLGGLVGGKMMQTYFPDDKK
jgi:hypothetical protein